MKQRILGWTFLKISVIILGILGYIIYSYYQLQHDYSFKGIELQKDYYLLDESITEKEQEIYERLETVETRTQLKDYYYGLGYLKFFSDDYELSNEWFLKALEIDDDRNNELQVMIMIGISNNYYLLNNESESSKYYHMAIDKAMEHKDEALLARIFRARASLYMNRIEHLEHATRLINFALYLETDSTFQIESYLLLAQIYMVKQDYQMMYQSLQQAWISAEQYKETELLTEVNILSIMGYFLEGNYEKVIECFDYLSREVTNQDEAFNKYIDELLFISCYSQYYLEGYECALKLLNRHQNEMLIDKNYYKLAKIGLLINEGQYEEANQLLEQVKPIDGMQHLESVYHLVLSQIFDKEIDFKEEYNQLLDEMKSSSKYSLGYYTFIGLNDRSIRENGDIDKSIMLDESFIMSKETSDLTGENLSLHELHQLISYKQWKIKRMQQIFIIICMSLIGLFLGRSIYFNSQKRKLKNELEFQKTHDSLTQTVNYEYVDEEIRLLKGSHREIQFFLFDMQSLKKYNETYGYLAGNQVIKRVAYLLKNDFPNGWITRYNGYQFLVVITDTNQSIDYRVMKVIQDFENLNIDCVTDLSSGKFLMRGAGACYTLTKEFNLDECMKVLEQRLQLMK